MNGHDVPSKANTLHLVLGMFSSGCETATICSRCFKTIESFSRQFLLAAIDWQTKLRTTSMHHTISYTWMSSNTHVIFLSSYLFNTQISHTSCTPKSPSPGSPCHEVMVKQVRTLNLSFLFILQSPTIIMSMTNWSCLLAYTSFYFV